MKPLIFCLLLAPVLIDGSADLSVITNAISKGDSVTLGKYFDQAVEIAVLDDEDVYSKTKAVEIVRSFFSNNTPKAFIKAHEGTSKGNDSQYCIGNLRTDTQTFRVYIYVKVIDGAYLIQELRFDKE